MIGVDLQHLADDDPTAPWMQDVRLGGMKPSSRRNSWQASQARVRLVREETFADDLPPVQSREEFGIPDGAEPIDPTSDFHAIAGTVQQAATVNRFTLEMLDDIAIPDEPVELVQGLLPMGPALAVVFGPPKSLKSFLLTHVGLHIADNRPFCGRSVQVAQSSM